MTASHWTEILTQDFLNTKPSDGVSKVTFETSDCGDNTRQFFTHKEKKEQELWEMSSIYQLSVRVEISLPGGL